MPPPFISMIIFCLKSFTLAAWSCRRVLLLLLCAASVTTNLLLLLSFKLHAPISWQLFYDVVLLRLWKVSYQLLNPPYLYVLLNIILLRIVFKSGILTPASRPGALSPMISDQNIRVVNSDQKNETDSLLLKEYGTDAVRWYSSVVSSPEKGGQALQETEISNQVIQPGQGKASPSRSKNDSNSSDIGNPENGLRQPRLGRTRSKVEVEILPALEMQIEASPEVTDSSRGVVMQGKTVSSKFQMLKTSTNGGHRHDQLVNIKSEADSMTAEEFQKRADSFISGFRKQLSMQREDSFNKLYLLGSTGRFR